MGKTVQMLGLLSTDRRKPNLIVAYDSYLRYACYLNSLNQFCHMCSPTVAIMQWRNEIEAHTTGFTVSRFIVLVHEARAERTTPIRPSYGTVFPARRESQT